jgi:hypothetical protein
VNESAISLDQLWGVEMEISLDELIKVGAFSLSLMVLVSVSRLDCLYKQCCW